jgi:hypothetical protein
MRVEPETERTECNMLSMKLDLMKLFPVHREELARLHSSKQIMSNSITPTSTQRGCASIICRMLQDGDQYSDLPDILHTIS